MKFLLDKFRDILISYESNFIGRKWILMSHNLNFIQPNLI